ncbi:MAG: T9SS type A sorting domain-containing protein [Fluviicola sp.]|nr:T9SS type A sorting domain-containing protein [Fluviicola sp.]
MKQILQIISREKNYFLFSILLISCLSLKAQCDSTFTFTTDSSGYTLNFTPQDQFAIAYSWNFGDGNDSNISSPSYNYADTGSYNVCLTVTTLVQGQQVQCTSCQNIVITSGSSGDSTVSIQAKNNINYSVYPNPFSDKIIIDAKNHNMNLSIQLISSTGTILYQDIIKSTNHEINTLKLEKGIYFLKVSTTNEVLSIKKIIKY